MSIVAHKLSSAPYPPSNLSWQWPEARECIDLPRYAEKRPFLHVVRKNKYEKYEEINSPISITDGKFGRNAQVEYSAFPMDGRWRPQWASAQAGGRVGTGGGPACARTHVRPRPGRRAPRSWNLCFPRFRISSFSSEVPVRFSRCPARDFHGISAGIQIRCPDPPKTSPVTGFLREFAGFRENRADKSGRKRKTKKPKAATGASPEFR